MEEKYVDIFDELKSNQDRPLIEQKRPLEAYLDLPASEVAKRLKATLLSIAFDDTAFAAQRIAAIDKWLDREMGKPIQQNIIHINQGDEVSKALAEIHRREEELGYVIEHVK